MTTKQMQLLLQYLAEETGDTRYSPGGIDGIQGKKTNAALDYLRANYGVGVDGLVGVIAGTVAKLETVQPVQSGDGSWWDEIKYFSREEFQCKCGGKYCNGFPAEPVEKLVRVADAIREELGSTAIVSSGVRCEAHNAAVGGAATSRHKKGWAMDFCVKGVSGAKLDAVIGKHREIAYHYHIGNGYCHMDVII